MSMALQQEVVALRTQLHDAVAQLGETRTQLSKLSAQFVVGESKRADLAARIAQLEDALAASHATKEPARGPRAKARV